MKKILIAILLLSLAGCSAQPKSGHGLKTSKDKVLSYKIITEYHPKMILGGGGTSTESEVMAIEEYVEYDYVSEIVATNAYFDKNNTTNISGAEILPTRKDGKSPIAFHSENKFYKDVSKNKVFEIGKATTTVDDFNDSMRLTLAEKIRNLFINTAIATTTATTTTTYTPPSAGTVEILVVAGGGGGNPSYFWAGGAGAGGYFYNASQAVNIQEYAVVVGSGGTPGANNVNGGQGGTSSFGSLVSMTGGGGGPGSNGHFGLDGGSGSGGGGQPGTGQETYAAGGEGVDGQGYDGGKGYKGGAPSGGGGGGGAGGAGQDGSAASGGAAGPGVSNSISGSAVTYAVGAAGGVNTTTPGVNTGSGGKSATKGADGIIILVFTSTSGGSSSSYKSPIINFE